MVRPSAGHQRLLVALQQGVMRPGDRGARQQQDHRVEQRQMERIEGVDGGGRPHRLAVALQVGEQGEVEERPEEADEEHHLGGDEEQHAVAQAEPHDGRVQAGRAALADHVAPPEEHRAEHHHRADDQRDVAAEMRGEDDAEHGEQTAERADDRPGAGIDQMIGLLAGRNSRPWWCRARGRSCRTHFVSRNGVPHHREIVRAFKGSAASADRHAAPPARARRTSPHRRACGRTCRTA